MKLKSDEFNELQRWIEVRDCCQEAVYKLREATNYANGHNYDSKEYAQAIAFIDKLRNKAISKMSKFLDWSDEE